MHVGINYYRHGQLVGAMQSAAVFDSVGVVLVHFLDINDINHRR
jgi:hypothetical protein